MQTDIPDALCRLVEAHIPEAEVHLQLYAGDDHFDMNVISPAFAGMSRVAQHQMVYETLGDLMQTHIHILALRTFTPAQWRAETNMELT